MKDRSEEDANKRNEDKSGIEHIDAGKDVLGRLERPGLGIMPAEHETGVVESFMH